MLFLNPTLLCDSVCLTKRPGKIHTNTGSLSPVQTYKHYTSHHDTKSNYKKKYFRTPKMSFGSESNSIISFWSSARSLYHNFSNPTISHFVRLGLSTATEPQDKANLLGSMFVKKKKKKLILDPDNHLPPQPILTNSSLLFVPQFSINNEMKCTQELSPILYHLFDLSLYTLTFLTLWKLGNTQPIHEKCDPAHFLDN